MARNIESLVKKALDVDCGNYDLRYSELMELTERCQNNFANGSFVLFKIGFLKGQRAERARQKNRRK